MQINSIVIVGGGTAGWMTATSLSKHVPEIDVTLIESPDVPSVGVGESTTFHINAYLQNMGIEDGDWMTQCNAIYKGSIKFTDFYKKGEFFHYPFGAQDFSATSYGTDAWFLKKWIYPDTPQTDFCESYWPNMQMINKNKIHSNEDCIIPSFRISNDFSYQFDTTKLGNWLKTNCCTKVKHILDHVTNVNLDERGWISSLSTKKHGLLKADLYIDCTGFSSVLLEKSLGVPHSSYKDMLINNGTWATKIPYVDPNVEMDLTTNGTAIDNGWVWNIPLWDCISNGYVYSEKFIDKEIALKEFKEHLKNTNQWCKDNDVEELEYRHIDIRNGAHEKAWHKNCIAIGLSYGFIEPLESTGLVFVIQGLNKLMSALQTKDRYINQFDRDCVNREIKIQIDTAKYFVAFHFYGTVRNDTEYWRWYSQELEMGEHWNTDLAGTYLGNHKDETMDISRMRFATGSSASFSFPGWACVVAGHHINLYSDYERQRLDQYDPMVNKEVWEKNIKEVINYWKERNTKISLLADKSPTHYEYLKEKIYNQM